MLCSLTLLDSATDIPIHLLEILARDSVFWLVQREKHCFFQDSRIGHYGKPRRIRKRGSLQGHGVEMCYCVRLICNVEYHQHIVVDGLHGLWLFGQ